MSWERRDLGEIQYLIDIGRHHEALQDIIIFQLKYAKTPEENLQAELMRVKIFTTLGQHQEALHLVKKIYDEGIASLSIPLQLDVLNGLGNCLYRLGSLEEALAILSQAKQIFEKNGIDSDPEKKKRWAHFNYILGGLQWQKGQLPDAISQMTLSRDIYKECGATHDYIKALTGLGLILGEAGNYSQALISLHTALELEGQIGNEGLLAIIYTNIAEIYHDQGELDRAIEYQHKSLKLREKTGQTARVRYCLNSLAKIYRQKGDLYNALKYSQRAVKIAQAIRNNIELTEFLFELFWIYIELNSLEDAQTVMDEMSAILDFHENPRISQRVRLARGIFLKSRKRVKDYFMAQEIFKQLVAEPLIDHEIVLIAYLNLCDLLLVELKIQKDIIVINEFEEILAKLLGIAAEQHSFLLWTEIYLLKAKVALIHGDIKDARLYLIEAQKLAEEKDLTRLAQKISEEHDSLLEKQQLWEELSQTNINIEKKVQLAQLDDHMSRLLRQSVMEPQKIQAEEPISLIFMTEEGRALFYHSFKPHFKLDKTLISGLISAFNSMSGEVFSESLDRAKFGSYNILVQKVDWVVIGYLFIGATYPAKKRMEEFCEGFKSNPSWITEFSYLIDENISLSMHLEDKLHKSVEQFFEK